MNNHCEIIAVSKNFISYAEQIAKKLKNFGIQAVLLSDHATNNRDSEHVQSQRCLFVILLLPVKVEQNSVTIMVSLLKLLKILK